MRKRYRRFATLGFGLVGGSLVLALASCSSEPAGQNSTPGAGGTGNTGAMGGAAGATAGAPVAGAPAAGAPGTGGVAGAATGGVGGSAGTVAGAGPSGGMGGAGAPAGGQAGMGPSGGTAGAGGATAGAGNGGVSAGGMSGTSGGSGTAGGSGAGSGSGGAGAFTLTSPDHAEGAVFADPYTCAEAGFNGSILPELHWTPGPAGTQSYAITFIDVTLTTGMPPSDLGYHWVIWNIPATTLTLPEAFKDQATIGATENRDFLGPCPNSGGGSANTDTYEFTIYALSTPTITITGTQTAAVKDAEMKLEAMNLASAKLTGTSSASP